MGTEDECVRVARGGSWSRRSATSLLAIVGVLLGAAEVSGSPVQADEVCSLEALLACTPPAPPSTTSSTSSTTSTTSTTVAPPPPTAAEATARLLELVNVERERAGLGAVVGHGGAADIAAAWSGSMAGRGRLAHNDEYFSDDTRRRLGARRLGENVARAGDIDAAHRALMASAPHRANILDARFDAAGMGAVLRDGSWWVTQDFLQSVPAAKGSGAPTRGDRSTARPVETQAAAAAPASVVARAASAPGAASTDLGVGAPAPVELRRVPAELPGEHVVGAAWTLGALGALLVAAAGAAALRAASAHARGLTAIEPAEPAVEAVEAVEAVDDVKYRLAVVDAWAATLDDRWTTLSEADKRVAVQVIRRNTAAARDGDLVSARG